MAENPRAVGKETSVDEKSPTQRLSGLGPGLCGAFDASECFWKSSTAKASRRARAFGRRKPNLQNRRSPKRYAPCTNERASRRLDYVQLIGFSTQPRIKVES